MSASQAYGERPPMQGAFRRSFTIPARSLSFTEKAGLDKSDANADIFYTHPAVRIISFSPPTSSIKSTSKAEIPADTDYPVDTVETLPWRSRTETLAAAGQLIIEKVRGSTNFLKCQGVMHAIMRNSQCWCVDGESKFVLRVRQFKYYRIELPSATEEDKAKVEELKKVLPTVLRYERTPCPFIRAFTVDLPEDAITPRRKGQWKRRDSSQPNTPDTETPPLRRTKPTRSWSMKNPPTSYPKNGPDHLLDNNRGRPGSSSGSHRRGSLFESYRNSSPASFGRSEDGTDSEPQGSEHDSELESGTDRSANASPRKHLEELRLPKKERMVVTPADEHSDQVGLDDAADAEDLTASTSSESVSSEESEQNQVKAEMEANALNNAEDVVIRGDLRVSDDAQREDDSKSNEGITNHGKSTASMAADTSTERPETQQHSLAQATLQEIEKSATLSDQDPDGNSEEMSEVSDTSSGESSEDDHEAEASLSGDKPPERFALSLETDLQPGSLISSHLQVDGEAELPQQSGLPPESSLEATLQAEVKSELEISYGKSLLSGRVQDESNEDDNTSSEAISDQEQDSSEAASANEKIEHHDMSAASRASRELTTTRIPLDVSHHQEIEDYDALSPVSSVDSFHTIASSTGRHSISEESDVANTPVARLQGPFSPTKNTHKRELSEITVTASSASMPTSPEQYKSSAHGDMQPREPTLQHSLVFNTSKPESETSSAVAQDQESLRQRLKARRSFSPMPPASTIFTGQIRHDSGSGHMTKAILQKVIVKPIEAVILVVHVLARIANGATVSDLLSGDLFKRPEHRRSISGFADQLNRVGSNSDTEDDFGVPVRGRRRSTERRVAMFLDEEHDEGFGDVD